MKFTCSKCGRVYNLDASKIPDGKKTAKCKVCGGIIPLEVKAKAFEASTDLQKCKKCGYTRQDSDYCPEWQCPSCGIAYGKIANNESGPKEEIINEPNKETPKAENIASNIQNNFFPKEKIAIVYICFALILGYFIGREHLRYEIGKVIEEGVAKVADGIGKGFGPSKKRERLTEKTITGKALSVKLLGKKLVEENYQEFISISLLIKNTLDKEISACQGTLVFSDVLGNVILKTKLKNQKEIKVDETIHWSGGIKYNQFIDEHKKLLNSSKHFLRVKYILETAIYTDGKTEFF